MDQQHQRLPVGVRFRPTQEELIRLLQFKAGGGNISECTNSVLEKNLYGEGTEHAPWNVFTAADEDKWELYDDGRKDCFKRVIYVVTRLSKIGPKNTLRTAGRGTWDGQTKGKPIKNYAGDKILGSAKMLTYLVDPGSESEAAAAEKGYWYMHEISLSEESLKEVEIRNTDYVICRIIRDFSKSCQLNASKVKKLKTGKAPAINNVGQESTSSQITEPQPYLADLGEFQRYILEDFWDPLADFDFEESLKLIGR